MHQPYVTNAVVGSSVQSISAKLYAPCVGGVPIQHSEGLINVRLSCRLGTKGPSDATREHLLPSGLKMVEKGSQTGL